MDDKHLELQQSVQSEPVSAYQENFAVPTKKHPRKRYIVGVIIACFVIIASLLISGSYAIAYQNVSIGSPTLEVAITRFVQALPFAPKTPLYLLAKMVDAQNQVSKHQFDASIAMNSNQLSSQIGLQNLDAQMHGNIDYSDKKNVITNFDINISNQYLASVRKPDSIIYVKADKIPALFFLLFGINEQQSQLFMNQWIAVDTAPLETEARKKLEENTQITAQSQQIVNRVSQIMSSSVVQSKLSQSQEELDTVPTYKLHFVADPATIDYLGEELEKITNNSPTQSLLYAQNDTQKPSDVIKDLTIDLWIDQKQYYLRKLSIATSITDPQNSRSFSEQLAPSSDLIKAVLVLKFSNFGENFSVEKPSSFTTLEDLAQQFLRNSSENDQ